MNNNANIIKIYKLRIFENLIDFMCMSILKKFYSNILFSTQFLYFKVEKEKKY